MNIAVFGATGKIGRYLVQALIEFDSDIHVYAIGRRKTFEIHSPRIQYCSCDITKRLDFEALPQQINVVINLAGAVTTAVDSKDVCAYVDINIVGAVNIYEYAKRAGADRVLYAQTYNDVFGEGKLIIEPNQERKKHYSGNAACYAITKNAAVDLGWLYQEQGCFKLFVFRLPTVYCYTKSPYYLVGGVEKIRPFRKMIQLAIDGKPIEVWGNPNHMMDIVYVKDCCQLFCLALRTEAESTTYNVGTGVGTTLLQQAQGMIEVFSQPERRSEIVFCPDKPNGKPYIMNIESAKNELGYCPKYDYISILREFKTYMKADGIIQ